MANNRMYLCCLRCLKDEEVPREDCFRFIAKYLLGDEGWVQREPDLVQKHLLAWLSRHNHYTSYGTTFRLVYEPLESLEREEALRRILAGDCGQEEGEA